MPIEIEAKMKVADHESVRARLRECGATSVGTFLEVNSFFDREDRSLLAADQGLRLRKRTDLQTGANIVVLTFKGPRKHGPLKSREETELQVFGERDASALLVCLGFQRVLSFEKKRESWKLLDCSVELDELPDIGTFVEIEGPDEAKILHVRDTLGLGNRPLVKASYIALLMSHLQEQGRPDRVIAFRAAE